MKWMKTCAVMISLGSLLLTTASFAAKNERADIYRASKLIGADVENLQGEKLGDIKDVVLDPETGRMRGLRGVYGGGQYLTERGAFVHTNTTTKRVVSTAIRESINQWGGIIGAATCGYKFLDDLYDEQHGVGIVRIRAAWLDHFRSALILLKRIGTTTVLIDILGVSGILKKAAAVAAQRR